MKQEQSMAGVESSTHSILPTNGKPEFKIPLSNDMDEFAASMDAGDTAGSGIIESSDFDLEGDVATNLSILEQLFPNKPKIPEESACHEPSHRHLESTHSSYLWSDDESSDNRSRSVVRRVDANEANSGYDMDEFAACIDGDDGEGGISSEVEDDKEYIPDGLRNDVESNLKILGQLFPELSEQLASHTKDGLLHEKTVPEAHPSKGWGSLGQMLRYDPSNPQTSQQFLIHQHVATRIPEEKIPPPSKRDIEPEHEQPLSSLHDQSQFTGDQVMERPENEEKSSIYEQEKLEQVFKEVREASSSIVLENPGSSSSSFSFGFDLQTSAIENSQSSGFSFSFLPQAPHPNDATPKDSLLRGEASVAGTQERAEESYQSDQNNVVTGQLCRGFEFPSEEELDKYVSHFYLDFNEGSRILNDLEGWRQDPAVKQTWMKERLALTQDWKRKRKYALSKKQKRFR